MTTHFVSYLNGQWVPNSEFKIDAFDRGVINGDAIFDSVRTYGGKIFKLDRHVDRIGRSLKFARLEHVATANQIGELMEEAVDRNKHQLVEAGDFAVWPFITRGSGPWAYKAGPGTVGVRIHPVDFARFAEQFISGVHGVIVRVKSYRPSQMEPKVKHYTRGNFAQAELEANDVVTDGWPILTDGEGNLTEGTINNVFLVNNGVIKTPADTSILQGVSRSVVFDLARQLNIPIVEESLQPYDLYNADESFVSFTGPGVLPMTHADKRMVGPGNPGPVTKQLLAAWSEMVGVDIVGQAKRMAKNNSMWSDWDG